MQEVRVLLNQSLHPKKGPGLSAQPWHLKVEKGFWSYITYLWGPGFHACGYTRLDPRNFGLYSQIEMFISVTIPLGISLPILVMETQSIECSRDYLITAVQQQGVYLPSSQGLLPGPSSQAIDRGAQDFPEYCSFWPQMQHNFMNLFPGEAVLANQLLGPNCSPRKKNNCISLSTLLCTHAAQQSWLNNWQSSAELSKWEGSLVSFIVQPFTGQNRAQTTP